MPRGILFGLPRNDPTDTGGLFVGRRPGTRPLRYRETPVTGTTRRRRADEWLARLILVVEVALCLTLWGPQPAAWLWVGGHVQGWTGSVEPAITVAFVGMLFTLFLTLVVVKRRGARVSAGIALVSFTFWFL